MAEHSRSGSGMNAADVQLPPGVVAQAETVASNHEITAVEPEVPSDCGSSSKQNLSAFQGRHPAGVMAEVPVEDAPPPVYSESYGLVDMSQLGLNTRANVASKNFERQ